MERTFLVRFAPGRGCAVSVSDEPWKGDLSVTGPDAVTPERIEAAARRKRGLPLVVAETVTAVGGQRVVMRELTETDLPAIRRFEAGAEEAAYRLPEELLFTEPEYLSSYVRSQYPFFDFGLWGLFPGDDGGQLIGLAGFSADGGEVPRLGYHIAAAFRRQGLGYWAAMEAVGWYQREAGGTEAELLIDRTNLPSLRLAEKLKASCRAKAERFLVSITIL